ncbi:STAS domain-containing protein [Actinokineospora soli]|uniref:STAS domain-containing protein n=1 Tax=Actinokineospora soli TaxID=1048753 RepID=A0ABW2TSF3_9PSEU
MTESVPPPLVDVRVEEDGQCTVVTVVGEVDASSVEAVTPALAAAVDARPGGVVVDLAGVRFFGSAGLSALLAVHDHALLSGVPLVLVCSAVVARVLDVTETRGFIAERDDVASARKSVGC